MANTNAKGNSSNVEEDLEIGCIISDSGSEQMNTVERSLSFTEIYQSPVNKPMEYKEPQTWLLAYQALGVVYGDLGTSPVNTFSSTVITNLREEDLIGLLSLIFWTMTLICLVKYTFIVLHANDQGEGGTFALYSIIRRHISFNSKLTLQNSRLEYNDDTTVHAQGSPLRSKTKKFLERSSAAQNLLTFVVLLATCMVIGDGALTAATCVLPALQGLTRAGTSKITQDEIVFIAVVVLILLFTFQRCGTSKISFAFSPIMLLWFGTNAAIGIYNIVKHQPSILKAISPHYIFRVFSRDGKTGWDLLGAVFLSITGAEAMYADMGHFNKRAIQLSFTIIVYPAVFLAYAGETAYLIQYPDKISDAYYSSIPKPVYWPMFILSNLSAIIASQSMISACFSLVKQSQALGCFPRVHIIHTSSKHEGQVYCPETNYGLMVLCVGLVIGFKDGAALANAYGAVVIWVMIITTCLTTLVMLLVWDTNILLILMFFVPFILLEGCFMTSLLTKIPQGGWVPFAISAFFLAVMFSWLYGRSRKSAYEANNRTSLSELNKMLSKSTVYRAPGTCFFYTDLVNGIPPIIRSYIKHTSSVHETLVIVTFRMLPIPMVLPEERFHVTKLEVKGVYLCLVRFGYKDYNSIAVTGDDFYALVVAKLREHADTIEEKEKLDSAKEKGVFVVIGRTILKANQNSGWFTRFTINYLYRFLQKNCKPELSIHEVPPENTLQIGILYKI